MCEYCTKVKFETDDPRDRNKLLSKQQLSRGLYINGCELLTLELHLGYFSIISRGVVNYCPMCGRDLKED
ncbi:MAG: hypothetical protein RR929_00175 [Erysipelotrichaceae bacterium]